jgi:hypothetical protein
MARAMSSLPVSNSPEMHTLASPRVAYSTRANTSWTCSESGGEHERIPTIIFGVCDCVAVAEAV